MSIHIAILPGLTPHDVQIEATGHQYSPLTADICKDVWGIDDLGAAVADVMTAWGYTGVRVDEVVWNPSTLDRPAVIQPNGHGLSSYSGYGYPCYARFGPVGSRLREIDLEVVLADHALWDNRGNPDVRHFEASMSVESSTSVSSEWSRTQTIGITAEIGTSIGPVDAKTSISYEDSVGESHGESHGESISFSNSISGDLQPGELQVAAATQQRGFAVVEIDFAVSVVPYSALYRTDTRVGFRGNVFTGNPADGQHNYDRFTVDFVDVLNHLHKPHAVQFSRTDKIGTFADADLKSYPVPDDSPASIDAAVGAHPLKTIYSDG